MSLLIFMSLFNLIFIFFLHSSSSCHHFSASGDGARDLQHPEVPGAAGSRPHGIQRLTLRRLESSMESRKGGGARAAALPQGAA